MDELTQWVDRKTERRIQYALARSLGNMELATTVTKAGMSEIGRTHCYAARKVAATLAVVDHEVQAAEAAGHMTPAKRAAVQQSTEQYLADMLGITYDAGAEIIGIFVRR
jgi:hypothetical protein